MRFGDTNHATEIDASNDAYKSARLGLMFWEVVVSMSRKLEHKYLTLNADPRGLGAGHYRICQFSFVPAATELGWPVPDKLRHTF